MQKLFYHLRDINYLRDILSFNKTKQNKTKQNKTKQNKTKRNETKQNKTYIQNKVIALPIRIVLLLIYSYNISFFSC